MELKPGYKLTEVGVIPEEWDSKSMGEIADIYVGRDLQESRYSRVSDSKYKFPVYSNTVANDGLYGFYSIPEYEGDSVTVVGRGVGLGTAFARTGGYGAIGRLLVLLPHPHISAQFLATYINEKINIFFETGGIPQLTGIQFSKYKVAVPSRLEQDKIATTLSDMDALLAALDRLIAKKRDLKQAAMQQLLTGKIRLPGFSGEWEVKRLGEVLTICHGRSQHKVQEEDGSYPILATGGQIGRSRSFLYDKPSVLIRRKGTIDQPQYMETPFWTVDTLFYSIVHDSNNAKFIFYCFCLINWRQYNEASGVPSLSARTIESIEVIFPKLDEQTAIATILSDMDSEITAIEQQRDKTRALKQAMMQELLTGKTRLITPGGCHD